MEQKETKEPAVRPRFGGRRYGLVSGTWIVFQDAPLAAVTRAAVTLAAGAATGPLLVLATERFVATALDVAGGSLPPGAIAAPVIALGALFAMQIVESVVRALADARIEAGLRRGFRANLTRKRARLDYHHVERSSTWDPLRRVAAGPEAQARPAPENGPVKQAFDDGVGLAALAVRVIGLAAVLARLGWWIVPAAVAITVPFVLLGIGSGRRHYELERKLSGRRRRAEYLSEEVLQGREAAQERALFDFGDYVNTRWRDVYEQARRLHFHWIVRLWVRYKGGAVPAIAVVIAAMLALLRPLQAGAIDVAFYVAAVMALLQAERVVAQELVQITSRLSQHREFFVDLTAFAAMAETPCSLTRRAPEEPFRSIEFASVSFTYPGTKQRVLSDVSFVVEAGRHYALVGANGSGKSTIAKLIMGLYRPHGGRILINGIPIGEWQQDALNGLSASCSRTSPATRSRSATMSNSPLRAALTMPRCGRAWCVPASATTSLGGCRGGTTRRWARCCAAAWTCPVASGSGSPWRVHSPPMRRCASWTSQRRPWIRSRRASCTGLTRAPRPG